MKRAMLDAVLTHIRAKETAGLVTHLTDGAQWAIAPGTLHDVPPEIAGTAAQALRDGRSRAEGDWFVQVFLPSPRLVVVGAVHVTQALAPIAALAGYAVTVVDPRAAFATEERLPGVDLRRDWPDEALAAIGIDRGTALVFLSHDPKIDDPGLHLALRSPAFYIGALGSRRTHAKRVARLREAGFGDDEIARIRAPIGLAIGAVSPAEIAVSIMAEITAARRGAVPA
jgi:xanthine dehydrogenase accessory factor